jgi:hypothetical protein
MRQLYIVAPDTVIDASVVAAAGPREIVSGIPRALQDIVSPPYPITYDEPDDPQAVALRQAAAVLRNTFQTTRTSTQINNCLDAITVILRRLALNDMNR